MGVTYGPVITLYRQMIRESERFHSFLFRRYAIRRIRDAFHFNRNLSSPQEVEQALIKARAQLELLRRQTAIDNMYKTNLTVTETAKAKSNRTRAWITKMTLSFTQIELTSIVSYVSWNSYKRHFNTCLYISVFYTFCLIAIKLFCFLLYISCLIFNHH